MTSRRIPPFLSALLLLPALPHNAGGWAVVTVRELPDHAVAGRPLEVAYVVRQHGVHALPGLQGRVVARAGTHVATAAAAPTGRDGHYAARLTLPRGGEWRITIHSGFGPAEARLLPLRVAEPGARALPALADAERGRHLYVAKGCATCHAHSASGSEPPSLRVGPDLTERPLPADYLARFLADPSIKPPQPGTTVRMPDLELAPREIASLVAFLNADRRVSRR